MDDGSKQLGGGGTGSTESSTKEPIPQEMIKPKKKYKIILKPRRKTGGNLIDIISKCRGRLNDDEFKLLLSSMQDKL